MTLGKLPYSLFASVFSSAKWGDDNKSYFLEAVMRIEWGKKCKELRRGDFPGGPVVGTLPSNVGVAGWIPVWGTKIPYASQPKKTEAMLYDIQ